MKRLIVIVFIIFGAFLTFSLYRTLAYDTSVVEETPSTTDLEYTFKIGNSSIKQITVDSGETRYYDIVLGNPNNAKISYSVYYEMVSPSTKPDDYKIEYTSKSTGDSTGIVNNNGNITLNIVVTNTSSNAVTVKVGTVAGYVKGGELTLNSGQVVIPKTVFPKATYVVEHLDDGTSGDSGSGVYKIEHSLIPASSSATGSDILATTDYRYYGANPNNYICLDMEGSSTCPDKHLYRIIGSIYEELEGTNRIKVIKATPLTDGTTSKFSWDYTSSNRYSNIWATITSGNYSNSLTSGSQLMKLLNSGLWWNGESGSYYNYNYSADALITQQVDFTNYKLSDMTKNSMSISRYYLGEYDGSKEMTTSQIFGLERGKNRYDTNRPLYWDGMVGLIYPSDYYYTAGNNCVKNVNLITGGLSTDCKLKSWIYNFNYNNGITMWTIMPCSQSAYNILTINYQGYINYNEIVFGSYSVFSSFYLTSNTLITNGDGSLNNPYLITLE